MKLINKINKSHSSAKTLSVINFPREAGVVQDWRGIPIYHATQDFSSANRHNSPTLFQEQESSFTNYTMLFF